MKTTEVGEKIKELSLDLAEKASGDRKLLNDLKCAAVSAKMYELAAKIRDIEVTHFPMAKIDTPQYKEAKQFDVALRMAGVTADLPVVWKILQVARLYDSKKGSTDMDSAAKIGAESVEIFGE